MKKIIFILTVLLSLGNLSYAQTTGWQQRSDANTTPSKNVRRLSFPNEFKLFQSNIISLRQAVATAPDRFASKHSSVIISIPNADGKLERFEIFEASNFEAALQAQYPQIRSYVGKGVDNKSASLRMSVDIKGIQTMVFKPGKETEFMEPYSADGLTYAVYRSSREKGNLPFTCSTEHVAVADALQMQNRNIQSNSGELLTFRLALSCNAEYTEFHGGTVEGALAAFNATMTRVNGVFEKDLAIHMNLIENTTDVIYTDAATDPYSNNLNSWNNQLASALSSVIGNDNFDIGHMFGASGGGGNAGCIGCVCESGKGRGITSPADDVPMGDTFDIDYVAHEMGHQFGANHTFSNSVEGSGVNVEPGSGSTIMGYAGITNQDIQAHSDDYFIYASIKQIQDNMVSKTCPVRTLLTNTAPVVNAGADYVIPISTPFILTGSATDSEGDELTYCWEQNDTATTQVNGSSQASATKTGGPNWRSYTPVAEPIRYFPPSARVAANQLNTTFGGIRSEAVSSVARELNFVLTTRDNVQGVGQTNSDDARVTVTDAAGPFLITSPNTNVSLVGGTNQTVTWNVAGTDSNGVNAAFVDIYLSTDGGLTFPTLLASKVPNDGQETVTLTATPGSTNRIMVKGFEHVFYDMSNANITISEPSASFALAPADSSPLQTVTACKGSNITYTISYETFAGFAQNATLTATGTPSGATAAFSQTTVNTAGDFTFTISNTDAIEAGFYPLVITATVGTVSSIVPVYLQLFNSDFNEVQLQSPANASTGQSTAPTFTWDENPDATQYDIEVATDAEFSNIVSAATVNTNVYQIAGLLDATTYYWRVLPKNTSCGGVFSAVSEFQTGQTICDSYESSNVPVTIPNSATTISSTLEITESEVISDLNITIDISHSWINDLSAVLVSPNGTSVELFTGLCDDSVNDISATFDDSGVPIVCGNNPGISGTVKASQLLSAFNGQNSNGIWTLQITDSIDEDGGSLNSWNITFCTTASLAVADSKLSNFSVYPNPSRGNFNVQFNPQDGPINIDVVDVRGRKIFSKDYANTGTFSQNIDLTGAQAGIYMVNVQSGNTKEVRKIIIQ